MTTINATALQHWISEVFIQCGFTAENAKISAQVLVEADLRGIDSHGVARLSGYVRLIQKRKLLYY